MTDADEMTAEASHEVVEAATDPLPYSAIRADTAASFRSRSTDGIDA